MDFLRHMYAANKQFLNVIYRARDEHALSETAERRIVKVRNLLIFVI